MKRGKQTILFVLCSIVLVSVHVWANQCYGTTEEILNEYAKANHMGELEEVLLEEEYIDGTLILGKAEKGLVHLSAKDTVGYSRKYELMKHDEGWAFAEDEVTVKYVKPLDEVFGYAESEEIAKLICWTGNNLRTCEKIVLYPDEKGLFSEAEQERKVIGLSESGMIWQPGGSRGWGSEEKHIYAVEGLDQKGDAVYWYSKYGFSEKDFSDGGYSLSKKIFDLVADAD